jgi:CO/xanthine dehydrogenase Mo-binding subunit
MKGAGESGTLPVPAVTVAAVEDALRSMGVDIQLHEAPLSPERLCELAGAASGRDELGGGDERSEALL